MNAVTLKFSDNDIFTNDFKYVYVMAYSLSLLSLYLYLYLGFPAKK